MVVGATYSSDDEDSARLLHSSEKESHYLKNSGRKQSIMSVLTGKNHQSGYTSTAPNTPETPEEKMNVAVYATEYDPSAPLGYTTATDSPQRSGFESTPTRSLYSKRSGSDDRSREKKPYAQSVFTQTLGYFDEICRVPQGTDDSPSRNASCPPKFRRPVWGSTHSDDDDSDTPSMNSLPDSRESGGYSIPIGTTSASVPNYDSQIPKRAELDESLAVEHENFEVVLDTTMLASPKRRVWFPKNKEAEEETKPEPPEDPPLPSIKPELRSPPVPEKKSSVKRLSDKTAEPQSVGAKLLTKRLSSTKKEFRSTGKKSLVKRLFSGIKKKEKGRQSKPPESSMGRPQSTELPIPDGWERFRSFSSKDSRAEKHVPRKAEAWGPVPACDPVLDPAPIQTFSEAQTETHAHKQAPANEVKYEDYQLSNAWTSLLSQLMPTQQDMSEPDEEKKEMDERSIEKVGEKPKDACVPKLNEAIEVNELKPTNSKDEKDKNFRRTISLSGLNKTIIKRVRSINKVRSLGKKEEVIPPPSPSPVKPKTKPAWKAVVDPTSGRTYYYHRKTRETTWIKPLELRKLEQELAAVHDETHGKEAHAQDPATGEPNENGADSAKRQDADQKYKTPEVDIGERDPIATLSGEADVTKESKQVIDREKLEMLGPSFDQGDPTTPSRSNKMSSSSDNTKEIERLLLGLSPPDQASMHQLMGKYRGMEDLLLRELRSKAESQPFDEPLLDEGPTPKSSPVRLQNRSMTFVSKTSATTKSSTITDKTERIKNTFRGGQKFETISENESTATSISSRDNGQQPRRVPSEASVPRKVPIPRERELKVEELTNRVSAETFDSCGRVVRGRSENEEGSYYGDNEVDDYVTDETEMTDDVSALSEAETDFTHRRENFEQARRRALDDAIEREDWDLAAALSEGMRNSNSAGDYAKAHNTWNQTELDKFIANNDWDAVKRYIARMRDSRTPVETSSASSANVVKAPFRSPAMEKQPNKVVKAPVRSRDYDPSLEKRIGSKSQLQHKGLYTDTSSWTSDSYFSEESYDSESS